MRTNSLKNVLRVTGSRKATRRLAIPAAIAAIASIAPVQPLWAFQIDTGNPDLKLTWDNTVKYNAAWRVHERSSILTAPIGQDDGDRNFDTGLISNRINLLSEFDAVYRNVGFRASATAFYDDVYNKSNDNDSRTTVNQTSAPYNEFNGATVHQHGRNIELLDAFAFGRFEFGEQRASIRAGRHTVLWGESLFFGSNGIAGGMAPVDVQKLQSVPNTTFKEAALPVNQVSGTWQITPDVSLGAFYQLEWEPLRLPSPGSYFSNSDVTGAGAERILIANRPAFAGGPIQFRRADDISAKDSGQGGVQLRFRLPNGETDYGLYLIHFHDKGPQLYTYGNPAAAVTNPRYRIVYPENVTAFGASVSRTFGQVNVAGEISARHNQPLVSLSQAVTPALSNADNDDHPLYAVGNSLHAQISALWTLPRTPLWQEASFAGEVAFNRRTSITKNPNALDPNTSRDALGLRFVFTPQYRQVLPGLDLNVPFGVGYNPMGRSSVISQFNNAFVNRGGDANIGVGGSYLDAWRFLLSYTYFYGKEGPFQATINGVANSRTFNQSLKDRDFVSFTVSRTF